MPDLSDATKRKLMHDLVRLADLMEDTDDPKHRRQLERDCRATMDALGLGRRKLS